MQNCDEGIRRIGTLRFKCNGVHRGSQWYLRMPLARSFMSHDPLPVNGQAIYNHHSLDLEVEWLAGSLYSQKGGLHSNRAVFPFTPQEAAGMSIYHRVGRLKFGRLLGRLTPQRPAHATSRCNVPRAPTHSTRSLACRLYSIMKPSYALRLKALVAILLALPPWKKACTNSENTSALRFLGGLGLPNQ